MGYFFAIFFRQVPQKRIRKGYDGILDALRCSSCWKEETSTSSTSGTMGRCHICLIWRGESGGGWLMLEQIFDKQYWYINIFRCLGQFQQHEGCVSPAWCPTMGGGYHQHENYNKMFNQNQNERVYEDRIVLRTFISAHFVSWC